LFYRVDRHGGHPSPMIVVTVPSVHLSAKSDGSAFWGLMGISFVYGIFHDVP
jgi:hypothetical protein